MSSLRKRPTVQESEDESLARFHRAVRDESELTIDLWSLPLDTLGVSILPSEPRILTLYVNEDVHIPSFPARVEDVTLRGHLALLRDNVLNTLKNIMRCAAFLPFPY